MNSLKKENLNDFENFDRILFTEDELKLPEKIRWQKYMEVTGENSWNFIIPIPALGMITEYQLCHYAMWNCIAYSINLRKPVSIIYYREGQKRFVNITFSCFACEFNRYIQDLENEEVEEWINECSFCPIFNTIAYECENTPNEYSELISRQYPNDYNEFMSKQCNDIESSRELAIKIAHYKWSTECIENTGYDE